MQDILEPTYEDLRNLCLAYSFSLGTSPDGISLLAVYSESDPGYAVV
jgi:hypothetical protein